MIYQLLTPHNAKPYTSLIAISQPKLLHSEPASLPVFLLCTKAVKTASVTKQSTVFPSVPQSEQAMQLHKLWPHQFTLTLRFIWQAKPTKQPRSS